MRVPSRFPARLGVTLPILAVALLAVAGCSGTAQPTSATVSKGSTAVESSTSPVPTTTAPSTSATPTPTTTPTPPPSPTGSPVHIKLFGSDGQTYGIGMPIIAYFSATITSAAAFEAATTVTVNGAPAGGAWYFEKSAQLSGYPIEGHYRPQYYWPGHASIVLNMATQGVSAGPGLIFDDSLTMTMSTGVANTLAVDGATERLTVTSDGVVYGVFPTSLGAANTPTLLGTKIIMEKDRNERMIGPGYNEIVPWSLRLTNSGEFLHAAAWNVRNIGKRSTSNGCTNLLPADAQRLFDYLQIGDPVTYTNVAGNVMQVWDGYGDWNVPWASWQAGGAVAVA